MRPRRFHVIAGILIALMVAIVAYVLMPLSPQQRKLKDINNAVKNSIAFWNFGRERQDEYYGAPVQTRFRTVTFKSINDIEMIGYHGIPLKENVLTDLPNVTYMELGNCVLDDFKFVKTLKKLNHLVTYQCHADQPFGKIMLSDVNGNAALEYLTLQSCVVDLENFDPASIRKGISFTRCVIQNADKMKFSASSFQYVTFCASGLYNLEAFAKLPDLGVLTLQNMELHNLDGLQDMKNLKAVEIYHLRLIDASKTCRLPAHVNLKTTDTNARIEIEKAP
ncbi:hypothetical protein LLG95_15605 [bacterium]|nr:hypothetical protein [bacterium]